VTKPNVLSFARESPRAIDERRSLPCARADGGDSNYGYICRGRQCALKKQLAAVTFVASFAEVRTTNAGTRRRAVVLRRDPLGPALGAVNAEVGEFKCARGGCPRACFCIGNLGMLIWWNGECKACLVRDVPNSQVINNVNCRRLVVRYLN
jgi:hypothetical protein